MLAIHNSIAQFILPRFRTIYCGYNFKQEMDVSRIRLFLTLQEESYREKILCVAEATCLQVTWVLV